MHAGFKPLPHNVLTPSKYNIFENIMENGAFAPNAPFSIIFSKALKTLLKFFLIFLSCLKVENDVMI